MKEIKTWADFKAAVEEAGIKNEDQVAFIDWDWKYAILVHRFGDGAIGVSNGNSAQTDDGPHASGSVDDEL